MRSKITSVTPQSYAQGTKTLYKVQADNGKLYTCFSKRIADMVGKEVEFTEENKPYNGQDQWIMNLPKEDGFAGGGGKKPYTPSFKDTKDAAVLSAKTMIWSYLKDFAIEDMSANKGTFESALQNVIKAFPKAIATLDLDKLPEAKQPVPPQPAPVSTLRQPLINLLKMSMNNLKFRAQDMVEYAAERGVELKLDVANDEVVWTCSEEEATKLINDMAESNIPF